MDCHLQNQHIVYINIYLKAWLFVAIYVEKLITPTNATFLNCLLVGGHGNGVIMSWKTRYNICLGVAHGLFYLHSSTKPKIIHRDIKASNILLDKDMNPKIVAFGLARPFRTNKSQITIEHHVGTM